MSNNRPLTRTQIVRVLEEDNLFLHRNYTISVKKKNICIDDIKIRAHLARINTVIRAAFSPVSTMAFPGEGEWMLEVWRPDITPEFKMYLQAIELDKAIREVAGTIGSICWPKTRQRALRKFLDFTNGVHDGIKGMQGLECLMADEATMDVPLEIGQAAQWAKDHPAAMLQLVLFGRPFRASFSRCYLAFFQWMNHTGSLAETQRLVREIDQVVKDNPEKPSFYPFPPELIVAAGAFLNKVSLDVEQLVRAHFEQIPDLCKILLENYPCKDYSWYSPRKPIIPYSSLFSRKVRRDIVLALKQYKTAAQEAGRNEAVENQAFETLHATLQQIAQEHKAWIYDQGFKINDIISDILREGLSNDNFLKEI
jgi:hypothetical protein